MKIAVIGAGALGTLFGALLVARRQDEVWLVGSESVRPHLDAIIEAGLRLEVAPGVSERLPGFSHQILRNLHVTVSPEEVYPADLALVLVKSYRTQEAARQTRALLAAEGCALTLQNGLGNLEMLAAEAGTDRAAQGVTALGATIPVPGTVRWTGVGPVNVGLTPELSEARKNLLLDFVARLRELNLAATTSENIAGLVWGKLIVNCAINAPGALLNLPNGELVARPEARQVLEAAATEAAGVARALGVVLPYPYEEAVAQAVEVARQTAPNINSMLADVRRGRPTEINAINGAVVREGQRLNLPTPVNWTLTRLVLALRDDQK